MLMLSLLWPWAYLHPHLPCPPPPPPPLHSSDLYSRERLDSYLSRALDVPLENGRLALIDEYRYVLTLDFAIKMLNIHERAQCGIPVIIEGETGVGKTALIEMLSRLWNYSLIKNTSLYKDRLLSKIKKHLKGELVSVT